MTTSASAVLVLLPTLSLLLPADAVPPATVAITRLHRGDVFDVSDVKCSMETCVGTSSGTALLVDGGSGTSMQEEMVPVGGRGKLPTGMAAAGVLPANGGCRCQCVQPFSVFRDDLQICVDDLQECSLASFVSGTTVQKIPYVFLPLQGQIVYPSAEIKISDTQSPICAISKAKYLTRGGWVNFKNQSDFEIPFQIHRENGRIMLLWLGDMQSRANIEGRLVLIEMICKETLPQDYDNSFHQSITPCISFRIAGTPNVKEVLFSNDIRTSDNSPSSGLTISELIAIAICSILLGLMYVASILLYLHVRKGRSKGRNGDVEAFKNPLMSNGITEEGIVKNNPLLQHSYNDNEAYESDEDRHFSISQQGESSMDMMDNSINHRNLTTAIVHPVQSYNSCTSHSMFYSDSNSIEKHPEEDISIVETLDNKEEGPDNIRSIVCANPRKKLYFNPDYFELELLMAPPPAALEFLEKIREVIHEAKRKITVKKFVPNLVTIPEDASEEDAGEKSSSCDKCKTRFKIKSATIQKWLMDVPVEVAKPRRKTQAPRVPVAEPDARRSDDAVARNDTGSRPEENGEPRGSNATEDGDSDDEDGDDEGASASNIECDSLERSTSHKVPKSGYHTPSEYGPIREDSSPVSSGCALPMGEELTVKATCAYDAVPKRERGRPHERGVTTLPGPDCARVVPKRETLPDVLNGSSERYSLVSEVYVNDSFNCAGASPDGPPGCCENIKVKGPGRITIEVADCPDDHPAAEDSDGFEPDTLDRNSAKTRRPAASGAPGNRSAAFGSLLEIYEANSVVADAQKRRDAGGQRRAAEKYLKPDPKHCRRQRCPSPRAAPSPPKNARVRSTSGGVARRPRDDGGCRVLPRRAPQQRGETAAGGASDGKRAARGQPADHSRSHEDSGYLSTESNESFGCSGGPAAASPDTDESGADSIDTDFKFFKTPAERNYYCDW